MRWVFSFQEILEPRRSRISAANDKHLHCQVLCTHLHHTALVSFSVNTVNNGLGFSVWNTSPTEKSCQICQKQTGPVWRLWKSMLRALGASDFPPSIQWGGFEQNNETNGTGWTEVSLFFHSRPPSLLHWCVSPHAPLSLSIGAGQHGCEWLCGQHSKIEHLRSLTGLLRWIPNGFFPTDLLKSCVFFVVETENGFRVLVLCGEIPAGDSNYAGTTLELF